MIKKYVPGASYVEFRLKKNLKKPKKVSRVYIYYACSISLLLKKFVNQGNIKINRKCPRAAEGKMKKICNNYCFAIIIR